MISPEELRSRLKKPAKASSDSDWSKLIGSPTSWFALVLSLISLYYGVIRQMDDVRVVIANTPTVYFDPESRQIGVDFWKQEVTLTNSGNRSAAITRIYLEVGDVSKSKEKYCPEAINAAYLYYTYGGSVLKPGEIASVQLDQIGKGSSVVQAKDGSLLFSSKATSQLLVGACLVFQVITPDNISKNAVVPLFETKLRSLAAMILSDDPPSLHRVDKPSVLLIERHMIFFD
jgi:hypothetical protein